ncbi:CU044_2847 family protein [Nocardia mexicana]|uniref:Trypsin-co-occurring domain-containing protein n=1 Tax=Nocardia mexicana TaxID=279262 RepID=A0A370GZ97_9NOCA|nr:CU044_2847 family protein [Nocardia mexicana]RDI48990.1 hypothetical protein DFR68_107115 [Nocardia mexicana]
MAHVDRVEMPDGTVVYARLEEDVPEQGGVDVGLRDRFKLENLTPTIKSVATSVHQSVEGLRADRVSVEFGLELSLDAGRVVAVLASGGLKATLKVKLDWDLGAPPPAGEQAKG